MWRPGERAATCAMATFIEARRADGVLLPYADDPKAFQALYAWSVADPASFWAALWRDSNVIADVDVHGRAWDDVVIGLERMAPPDPVIGPSWFPGARLNFAENLLRRSDDELAIVAWGEGGRRSARTWRELSRDVASVAASFRRLGVQSGDRVAAWMPNIPETIIAMLAAASLGAVFTSCSPDFGVDGIVDRFGQTEPVVLLYCDAYTYGGKIHSCVDRMRELLPRLPSVRHVVRVHVDGAGEMPGDARAVDWEELVQGRGDALRFDRVAFDHPLYIL